MSNQCQTKITHINGYHKSTAEETDDKILLKILRRGLENSRNNSGIEFPEITEKNIQLKKDQAEIGWIQLYYGRWALQWATIQDQNDENNGED